MIPTPWGPIGFLNPLLLAGLLALPLLYLILRVTPPPPKLIAFPPLRLLAGLQPKQPTPAHTPWWLLLLRLTIMALLIIAFARPVLNPQNMSASDAPLRLVISNGWDAAQTWELQMAQADQLLRQAAQARRNVQIATTAPEPGMDIPVLTPLMTAAEAREQLDGVQVHPWPAIPKRLADLLTDHGRTNEHEFESVWLDTGLFISGEAKLLDALEAGGSYRRHVPEDSEMPVLLRLVEQPQQSPPVVAVKRATDTDNSPFRILVTAGDGQSWDSLTLPDEDGKDEAPLTLSGTLDREARKLQIEGRSGAGAVYLLGRAYHKKTVGIVTPGSSGEDDTLAPFVSAGFYLTRALEPYTRLVTGPLETVFEAKPDVVILPDHFALPHVDFTNITDWVTEGGLLLRFSGPNLAQTSAPPLLPVSLRAGGRALGGAVSWDTPVKLARQFPQDSPFAGLTVPADISVSRQLLADPARTEEAQIWARLEDGTPLITWQAQENGIIVLIHTTATPEWSNLPLSGLYVDVLRRVIDLAGTSYEAAQNARSGTLQPHLVMTGQGALAPPPGWVRPYIFNGTNQTESGPSSSNPPGLYGPADSAHALNIGDHLHGIRAARMVHSDANYAAYESSEEQSLFTATLLAATVLFFLDWIVLLLMLGGYSFRSKLRGKAVAGVFTLAALMLLAAPQARAQNTDASVEHAGDLYLAYIDTGNAAQNAVLGQALTALSRTLARRTSVEPAGAAMVRPGKDALAFYPFLYWKLPETGSGGLDDEGFAALRHYLVQGGILYIQHGTLMNSPALQEIGQRLSAPALKPLSEDHVLTRSFYLLPQLAEGSLGTFWLSAPYEGGLSEVAPILIGTADWPSQWLQADGPGRPGETAHRFGVNLMMYALTGRYKADQVHIPHILERLGQ